VKENEDEAVESEGETDITAPCHRDESVSHVEIHAHQPQAASLNSNDKTCIAVQAHDLNVPPSKSSLHIIGRLTKANGIAVATAPLINNGIGFFFSMNYGMK